MLGNLPKCFLTYYKYDNEEFIFRSIVHILPKAALFKDLQRYNESAYLTNFK
jgi:hypothetical protein